MEKNHNSLNKFQEETIKIELEAKKQLMTYLVSAFGFIAGLAWNEVVKSFISLFVPDGIDNLFAKIIYAVAITIFVVILTVFLTSVLRDKREL